jgi:hypothetical protein
MVLASRFAGVSLLSLVTCASLGVGGCGEMGMFADGGDARTDSTTSGRDVVDTGIAIVDDVRSPPDDVTNPPFDTGIEMDVGVADTGIGTDVRVTDTGVRMDVRVTDTGVAPDVRVMDVVTDRPSPPADTGVGPVTGPEARTRAEVCARWVTDRAPGPSPEWTAGSNQCAAGTLAGTTESSALRILNGYRWLVGVDPVTIDNALEAQQQACAVMMTVNNMLSHGPPMSWTCYSAAGAAAAGSSNLALGTGAFGSVGLYINERGSDLGHRRWCLFHHLGPTHFGATNRASCMQVFRRNTAASTPNFVAYPNPGPAPIETFSSGVWHVQEARYRFSASGTVTITNVATGANMPVTMNPVAGSYGGGVAIAWRPNGWTAAVGTTYRVDVRPTTGMAFSYTTTPVMCP